MGHQKMHNDHKEEQNPFLQNSQISIKVLKQNFDASDALTENSCQDVQKLKDIIESTDCPEKKTKKNLRIYAKVVACLLLMIGLLAGSYFAINQLQYMAQHPCLSDGWILHYMFFLEYDFKDINATQFQQFQQSQAICMRWVLGQKYFRRLVFTWNSRQMQYRYQQIYIDIEKYNEEEKRLLFIFLRLYFYGGWYVHLQLLDIYHKIDRRAIFDANVGQQILFSELGYQNQRGIYVPKKELRFLKVDTRLSWLVRKMIKKIIAKQNWIDICEQYQCLVMDKVLKL